MDTEPLLGAVGAEVDARAASFGGKVLLVRRPGRRAPGAEEQHWFAVDTVRRTWVRGTWRTAADLLEAARALGAALSASHEEAEPMVLVCTHGIRDACCAVRGRPIVNTLARAFPDQVWESTHLGGHRFAGTLLSLPDGACFGRLDPAARPRSSRAHRQGHTDRGPPARHAPAGSRPCRRRSSRRSTAHGPASADDAVPGAVDVDGDHTHGRGAGSRAAARARSSSTSSPRRCPTPRSAAATGPRRTSRSGPACAPRFPPPRPRCQHGAMSATERYREARDLLISLRGRHDEALERFAWPDVGRAVQLGRRLVRRDRPRQRRSRRWSWWPRTARARRSASTRWPPAPTGSGAGCSGWASAAATRCCSCSATRSSCGTSCSR